ncbi:site-specific integrase, partial [Mycobacterium intracellulare]|uniref:tyrosine-type recombinase/integrase n=1 Tax=Mycobacterium intracellulare TaxID=1767 RepID=UPI001CDABACA
RERERIMLARETGSLWLSPVVRDAKAGVRGQTVAQYGSDWIKHRNIKESTRLLYAKLFDQQIASTLGQIAIAALTIDDVNRWHSKLLPDNPTRRSHAYGLLHAICASAVESDLLTKNPCVIKRAMNTSRKREPVLLTVGEVKAIADAIKPDRFKAMVLLSAWCGTRFGEITELRRKDISDDFVTVTVSRGVRHARAEDGSRCWVDTTKTGKSRTVVIPNHIRADVKHHLDVFVDADPNALLFGPTRSGVCHLSQNVFREALNAACKSAGRETVNVHALRHFAATMAARVGGTVAEVQNRLGHSTAKAAMLYQHSTSDRDSTIAAALSAMAESATH